MKEIGKETQGIIWRTDTGAVIKTLTKEFGKGFSRSNIYNMRLFYLTYQKFQTVSGKLSCIMSYY